MQGFKQFIMRGNAVDLAVGVVVGAAFNTIVNSLVSGMITPLIGALVKAPDFNQLYFTLNSSKFMYGSVINAFISFLIIITTIYFFVVLPINKIKNSRDQAVGCNNKNKTNNNAAGCRTPNTFSATFCCKAFITSNQRDDDAENNRL